MATFVGMPTPAATLGSDLSGVVEEAGPDLSEFKKGDEIYGVTNPQLWGNRPGARSVFFYVEVTTERLNGIPKLLNSRQLAPQVGTLLPLNEVRTAHEMLAGAPHRRGKIVLEVNG